MTSRTAKRRTRPGKPSRGQRLLWETAVEREISEILAGLQTQLKNRGCTQTQVAEALGWPPSVLSVLLRGEKAVPLDRLLLICKVIGVPSGELFVHRAPTAEEHLQVLLASRGHPAQVLGRIDEAELMSATRELLAAADKRLDALSASERAYLNKVVQWCQTSIALDKRAKRRRAGARARKQGRESGPVFAEDLEWPDFGKGGKH